MSSLSEIRRVLAHRDYRFLWLAPSASVIGDNIVLVALALFVIKRTGSASDLGLPDTDGEQFGGAQPAGLEAFAFLLRRSTAGSGWHALILPWPSRQLQLGRDRQIWFWPTATSVSSRAAAVGSTPTDHGPRTRERIARCGSPKW